MRRYITPEHNLMAHEIAKSTPLSWGESFRLVMRLDSNITLDLLKSPNSLIKKWDADSAIALAGHFWGLSKGYEEIQDKGRSFATYNLARNIYKRVDFKKECDFNLLTEKGVGDSLRQEAFDFFVAAHTHDLTPRSRELIVKGAVRYKRNLKLPSW